MVLNMLPKQQQARQEWTFFCHPNVSIIGGNRLTTGDSLKKLPQIRNGRP